ncbi:hypothetical protein [Flavobacterium ginsenosidimutans]|uniref:hypothetical protein n=1 Tax=Flavobacterium ginsenosidimutans TaxID=687844 RepID=UPI000DAEE8BD|nr:hypothetical protein [Flavobacterium ginsenosidimutans]KAF2334760.1 hypothetical protein DM444_06140 [Flavobacterium ginsenosidimutans]
MESKIIIRILIIIVVLAVSNILKKTLAKKQEVLFDESDNNLEIDNAIDFGYKMQWFAVKTDNKKRIAEILKLQKVSNCNWELGIQKAYNNSIFITPQIGKWTLVCGNNFSYNTEKQILLELSKEFGEAQYFATHRVSDYHSWMKAIDGKLIRLFTYSGEYENGYIMEGEPTEIEKKYIVQQSSTENDADYIDSINEQILMQIAENWSINPTKLSQRKDVKHEFGILGL